MKEKSAEKQMTINLIASIVSFAVNTGINFFLTPHLVSSLGTEAYGFIGLANNFVQYATVITAALNSMSGRFISVAYHRGDKEKAEKIFNSVLVADLFLAGVLLIVTSLLTAFLDLFMQIPENLIASVKITFGITFLTFVVSVVTAIFTTAAFVKNRVDINSVRDIISNLIKVAVIVALFTLFPAKLFYIALASLAAEVFLLLANVGVKKKLLPDIRLDIRQFDIKLVKTILAAGVWMSLTQLSNVLVSSVDLLVCNLTLGATVMGLLSLSKTIPHCIGSMISTLANVFTPHYTILYAKNDIKGLVNEVTFTSKIISALLTVPITGFIVFSYEFYTLWQPSKGTEEIKIIQILSLLLCIQYMITAHTQCLTMLSSTCNKLKLPVLTMLGAGGLAIIIELVVLNVFDLGGNGVYVIAAASSALMCLRAVIFLPIYAAHLLKQKWTTFYPQIIRGFITFFVLAAVFYFIKSFFAINGWLMFIVACLLCAVIGYALTIPLIFNRSEIKKLKNKLLSKLGKAKKA